VDGDDGAVAEQDRRVADLAHQGLDLAQGGKPAQAGSQAGHLVIAVINFSNFRLLISGLYYKNILTIVSGDRK
jgi:hypothetical protein